MSDLFCKIPIREYVNTRRCFITGEYCSKQTDIYKARKKLYEKTNNSGDTAIDKSQTSDHFVPEINAFVVMNFSNMSDVAYEQRLKPFIEGLTNYFYFTDNMKYIACVSDPCCLPEKIQEDTSKKKVTKINVVRADSSFVSNFVICNRVCQQMQIADLIVVDVSVKNANVFYELGMAIAMGKMILPVCFSDSYFHMDMEIEKLNLKQRTEAGGSIHHIARYTWRRHLFEYYGLRCKNINQNDDTAYLPVDTSGKWLSELEKQEGDSEDKSKENKRIDPIVAQYFEFPYIEDGIGDAIYKRLSNSYNDAIKEDNTLLLYTLERFLNREQVGQCIINYYNNITDQMKKLECFCGDRVGTLAQTNYIPEHDKDDAQKTPRQLPYNVSEIIHLGVNQATYATYQDTIKPMDFLNFSDVEISQEEMPSKTESRFVRFLKEYTGNRSMLMYPKNPVYVERYTEEIQKDLLKNTGLEKYFCLYHIMLHNLKFVREIVVDISETSLESLFWLGMAHGADVYAITVQRQETDEERKQITGTSKRRERSIFDVAGLWCAQFRSDDTQGFYHQLQSVNLNIEQHSMLLHPNMRKHEVDMLEQLWALPWEREIKKNADKILEDLSNESRNALESYYRTRFWRAMLKGNHVKVYVQKKDEEVKDNNLEQDYDPRSNISRWDFDATAALSRYLARRTPVGEYEVNGGKVAEINSSSETYNVINLGANSTPFQANKMPADLSKHIDTKNGGTAAEVRSFWKDSRECDNSDECYCKIGYTGRANYRGFVVDKDNEHSKIWFTQIARAHCKTCTASDKFPSSSITLYDEKQSVIKDGVITLPKNCDVFEKDNHIQLGQLLLWREDNDAHRNFYVSLVGVSGPATKALTSLLVSDPLKSVMFDKEHGLWKDKYWLSELQSAIRKKFIEEFISKFKDQPNIQPVVEATKCYLTTVLYRHFLPFLTKENENRIINGTEYFLRSLRISDDLNEEDRSALWLSDENQIAYIDKVVDELRHLIKEFCGVDALYQVKVIIGESMDIDSRSIVSIEPMKENGDSKSNHKDWLKCLYQKIVRSND